jgi:hypothetical protein
MPDNNAVFTEVLEVQVDTSEFASGLSKLVSIYQDFLATIGSKGLSANDVLGAGAIASVSKDLTQLKENLVAFTESFRDSFGAVGATIQSQVNANVQAELVAVDKEQTEISNARKKQLDTSGRAEAKYRAELASLKEAAVNDHIRAEEKMTLATQREAEKRKLANQKTFESLNAQFEKGMNPSFLLQSPAASPLERMFANMKKDIPELLGNVVRFQAAWMLVGGIISAVSGTISGIVNAFKEGWEYLTKLQATSAEMQGVLAGNVAFSADLAENFRIAGEKAPAVVKALQDIAAKTGIAVDTLDVAFTSFIENDGQSMTKSLQDSVNLVGLLAQGYEAVVPPSRVAKTMTAEIPKFLDETLPKGSQLGKILGLNADQLKKMVEQAKLHNDLWEQLAGNPKLQGFLNVQEQANLRMAALNEALENAKNRTFALLAGPMWERWIGLLQQAKDFYETHKNQIQAIAGGIGALVVSIFDFVGALFQIIGVQPGITDGFKAVGVILIALVESANFLLNIITLVVKTFANVVSMLVDPTKLFNKQAWADFWLQVYNDGKAFADKTEQDILRLHDAMTGDNLSGVNAGSGGLGGRVTGKNPKDRDGKPDNARLTQLEKEFKGKVDDIKAHTKEALDEIENLANTGAISFSEAQKLSVKELDDEAIALGTVIKLYREKYETAKNASPKSRNAAVDNLNLEADRLGNQLDKEQSAIHKDTVKKNEAEDKAYFDYKMKLAAAERNEARKNAAQDVAEHRITKSREMAIDLDALKKENDDEHEAFQLRVLHMSSESALYKAEKQKMAIVDLKYEGDKARLTRQIHEQIMKESLDERTAAVTAANDKVKVIQEELRVAKELHQSKTKIRDLERELIAAKKDAHDKDAAVLQLQLDIDDAKLIELKASHENTDALQKEIDLLKEKLNLQQQLGAADSTGSKKASAPGLDQLMSGTDGMKGFTEALTVASNALQMLPGIISNIKQGFQNGGVMGGIGSIMSTAASFDPEPISKAILSIGGSLFSMFGGMFKKAAQDMAKRISKEIEKIMKDFQNGDATLIETIKKLEAERISAINRLSGMKGGKDELAKILPAIDDQIAELKKQAKAIIDKFNENLAVLQLHSDALGSILKTWQDINKQVKEYLGAGGDKAKAAQFLSLSLQKLKEDTQSTLEEGEQQAIQDALKLNDLLQQRIVLINDEKKAEFDLMNAGALEKRIAPAIATGRQLTKLRADFKQQLSDVDQQIDLQTKTVDKEKQVFKLSSDIAALHRRDDELTLIALDKQIKGWQDMQKIIAGIVQGPNGLYGMTNQLQQLLGITGTPVLSPTQLGGGIGGGLGGSLGGKIPPPTIMSSSIGTLNINLDMNGVNNPLRVVDAIEIEIQRRFRSGRGGF